MKNRRPVRSARATLPAALVCILCLLIPGSAALGQPFPSFMLDSTIVRGPTLNDVGYTSVSFGPDIGLIVWVENSLVRGVRVETNGALLDSTPLDIGKPGAGRIINMRPGVAWGAQRFLVVWTEVDFQYGDQAYYAIVHEDGSASQPRLLQQLYGTTQTFCAAAGFDGTNFLAVWLGATFMDCHSRVVESGRHTRCAEAF